MFLFLTGVQGSVVEFVILIPIQKLILKSVSLWSNLELELESLNILKCFLCFLFSDFIQIVFLLEYFFFFRYLLQFQHIQKWTHWFLWLSPPEFSFLIDGTIIHSLIQSNTLATFDCSRFPTYIQLVDKSIYSFSRSIFAFLFSCSVT